ncbi:hypothetical protein RvY_17207 [Ramazzottius varieornatus]|uniref:Uncharacterized protein n=1 Tax=Ramazzottius varieornatus TaxID=947166 RepID=A0A1D1W5B5_RAMVA|nr:hypothetical protein RvY_17207 [Ramazzottius varieornatus]
MPNREGKSNSAHRYNRQGSQQVITTSSSKWVNTSRLTKKWYLHPSAAAHPSMRVTLPSNLSRVLHKMSGKRRASGPWSMSPRLLPLFPFYITEPLTYPINASIRVSILTSSKCLPLRQHQRLSRPAYPTISDRSHSSRTFPKSLGESSAVNSCTTMKEPNLLSKRQSSFRNDRHVDGLMPPPCNLRKT